MVISYVARPASNLKEDAPVNILTPTNLLLWTLLVVLLAWLVVFAYLALKREQVSTQDETQKVVLSRSPLANSAQQQLQKIATAPAKATALPALSQRQAQEEVVLERSLG